MGGATSDPKPFYPVFLDLTSRLAVVVGGGAAAERKIAQLVRYGADITAITPSASPEMRQLEADGALTIEPRGYVRGDLAGAFIAVCTETGETARAVFAEAESRGCLINVVGEPTLSNFIVPSNVRRGPLQIAISTSGEAPAVAKRLRRQLLDQFGPEWGAYVSLLGAVRALVFEGIGDSATRDRIIAAVAEADLLERIVAGEELIADDVYAQFAAADEALVASTSDTDSAEEAEPAATEEPA